MNKCIFCQRDSQNSIGIEHIIPESLSGSITLPRGCVCDSCNRYFSTGLDKAIQEYHFVGILKTLLVNETKKKKGPRLDLQSILFEREKKKDIVHIIMRSCKVIHDTQNHVIRLRFNRPHINMQHVSRAIHKIGFEFRCKYGGRDQVMSSRFDAIRTYIRFPQINEYWEFAQKPHQMYGKAAFEYINSTKYSGSCSMIRIFDLEFIINVFGLLPQKKLLLDEYEIITKDESSKIEYEELLLHYHPLNAVIRQEN
jgi:hypothetical protein